MHLRRWKTTLAALAEHQRLHYGHPSMPGLLRSLRLEFECEPKRDRLTRVGESIYRRLPIDCKQHTGPQSHWNIASGHGGKQRPEPSAELWRDLFCRSAICHST